MTTPELDNLIIKYLLIGGAIGLLPLAGGERIE